MPRTNEIDIYVFAGKRIRTRRALMGMDEKQLAKTTGLTLYMLRKYEAGQSKITMDKLTSIAKILDVPIGYFFSCADGD